MRNYDYEFNLQLKHNEAPAKIDKETGEYIEVKPKKPLPENKTIFPMNEFTKLNLEVIPFLSSELNHNEMSIIYQMIALTEYNTNSLEPLSNETSLKELSERFKIGINQVKKYFQHLYDLGVYAQFKVCKEDRKEFWILNPYIAFRGKLIEDSIHDNFKGTRIEKYIRSNKK